MTASLPTGASRAELEDLLLDDVPHGDLTTEALGIGAVPAIMRFTARDVMVASAVNDAAALIAMCGGEVELASCCGATLTHGAPILTARGPAGALLKSWKVAQTLIEVWSGVASAAREIVAAAQSVSPQVVVACTRKNTPGTKRFAAAAVKAGGAVMHRLGLSESILLFPEHRALLGEQPLAATVALLRRGAPEKKLVIEVTSIEAALLAAEAGFDVLQLEKFTPDEVMALSQQLSERPRRPQVAVAGGVNAGNAAAYAGAGADVLVTSAPYLAKPRDVQVQILPDTH
ncbi:molybdenum transport protein [Rhodopseudomonas faecalis]|uniref:Putative pyrophosphorylase ModD n=1 Tax=Rhodopseudomonas faecalis TaxID=99655 RepID=A0A318TJM8_9BRAD|nr:ModD protein [Rhodopseudomonas faecalis]PYF04057.1 molybdenum transport protein [Rhodopseudomonas faecalis]TAH68071.1 MAG: ModD protein [Rhodopseudomonas palustris]